MTLKEKFKQWLDTNPKLEIREAQLEVIADDYAIEVLEYYHNSLFFIPLKKDEAKKIIEHIKTEKRL